MLRIACGSSARNDLRTAGVDLRTPPGPDPTLRIGARCLIAKPAQREDNLLVPIRAREVPQRNFKANSYAQVDAAIMPVTTNCYSSGDYTNCTTRWAGPGSTGQIRKALSDDIRNPTVMLKTMDAATHVVTSYTMVGVRLALIFRTERIE
jgi:hypothetical protein